jgi:AhpC/TSA family
VTGAGAVPGALAPEFRLPLSEGGERGLADLVHAGGGVLFFFKRGCATSELVLSRLGALAGALHREGRPLLAVVQETEAAARALRAAIGRRIPLAWEDAPYRVSSAYRIETVPTLLVIDGTGRVAARLTGFAKSEYLALDGLLERALALGGTPPVLDRPEELPALQPG